MLKMIEILHKDTKPLRINYVMYEIRLVLLTIMVVIVNRVFYKNRCLYMFKIVSVTLFRFFILTIMKIFRNTTTFIS